MPEITLAQAVELFARATHGLDDAALEREWTWAYHHEEGLRFAFLGTYHELRDLAATTAAERAAQGPAVTTAQRVLAQYHAAYRDLQAVLLGVSDQEAGRAPAEGEWPLWVVIVHILETEQNFFARTRYAADQQRAGVTPPQRMPSEALIAFLASEPATDPIGLLGLIYGDTVKTLAEAEEAPLPAQTHGAFADLLAHYDALHERVLRDLASLTEDDLRAPSIWWEEAKVPARYRLHRFDAHLRQHTIQAEKTLEMLGQPPNEAKRLLRLVYAALAEAEGAALGAGQRGEERRRAAAATIAARAEEVGALLA